MSRPFTDHTGEAYGYLKVVNYEGADPKSLGAHLWRCLCLCGKTTVVRWSKLHTGWTRSCGCIKGRPNAMPGSSAPSHRHYAKYRQNAIRRGLSFELTQAEFNSLVQQPCYYCGRPPSQRGIRYHGTDTYFANGIDRIDSREGYVNGNVCACCTSCNRAKGTLSREQFIKTAILIAKHHGGY